MELPHIGERKRNPSRVPIYLPRWFPLRIFTVLLSLVSLITPGNIATYSNPLRNPNGSDPFIVYTRGYYYLLTTS